MTTVTYEKDTKRQRQKQPGVVIDMHGAAVVIIQWQVWSLQCTTYVAGLLQCTERPHMPMDGSGHRLLVEPEHVEIISCDCGRPEVSFLRVTNLP